jgi:Phage integrase family
MRLALELAVAERLLNGLHEWRLRQGRRPDHAFIFPAANDGPWRDHDWRNWRRRVYVPTARSCGLPSPRPYDLRHSFASLLIHEGQWSIVEIADQLGHNPNLCLSTYAHVMAELSAAEKVSAEEQIRRARSASPAHRGPNTAHERQLTFDEVLSVKAEAPQSGVSSGEPTGGLEPPTPSLRVKCSTS